MYLVFDTETTGLPKRWDAPVSDTDNWPRCVQIAWQLHDDMGGLVEHQDFLVVPQGYEIPFDAEQIHGISTGLAKEKGRPLQDVLEAFGAVLKKSRRSFLSSSRFSLCRRTSPASRGLLRGPFGPGRDVPAKIPPLAPLWCRTRPFLPVRYKAHRYRTRRCAP